jgi:endoglycosylceramidase
VVDRPYPRAVAGIPTGSSWDPTKRTYSLTYTRATRAPTVVWTSPLHYPRGYRASISGGRTISARNAPLLRMRNSRGARTVRIRLTPR